MELFLFQLDKAQTILSVIVRDSFYGRGFAGAAVAVKQDIICRLAGKQSKGVVDDLSPLALVARKLAQRNAVGIFDWYDLTIVDYKKAG